jgi:hypothetical protein
VKFAKQKAVVNGFTAPDFATKVRIDIRICRFFDRQSERCKADRAASD